MINNMCSELSKELMEFSSTGPNSRVKTSVADPVLKNTDPDPDPT